MLDQNITFGAATEISSASPLSFTLGQLTDAVRLSDALSVVEQESIIQWSEDTYGSVWSQLPELLGITPPEQLVNCWELFMIIAKATMVVI